MSTRLVSLKYMFLFDPSETWAHLYQFEDEIANYFAALGFQAEQVKDATGNSAERIFLITKLEPLVPVSNEPPPKTVKQVVKSLTNPKRYG